MIGVAHPDGAFNNGGWLFWDPAVKYLYGMIVIVWVLLITLIYLCIKSIFFPHGLCQRIEEWRRYQAEQWRQ